MRISEVSAHRKALSVKNLRAPVDPAEEEEED
jgi:hypothetical protein